jgi:ubiquitin C-terminal hydrolase
MSWKKNIQDYLSTKDFKDELVKHFPGFRGYDQHDAHEFCTSLLDIMSKELNRVTVKPKYTELKISSKETVDDQATKWFEYYKAREDSHVTDYFQGQTMTEIKCST